MKPVSIIIPALNEEKTIGVVIDRLKENLNSVKRDYEIIVVDDGSTDETAKISKENSAKVINHPVPGGYGLSIRDGILAAKNDYVAIIDADGTYPEKDINTIVNYLDEFDMVVGARTGKAYKESLLKHPLRKIFQLLCEFVTGVRIPDANSGFRAFRKKTVLQYKDNFCLGFSFTTTITLAFHLNGHFIKYVPIDYYKRTGKSHVRLFWDSLRSMQIITQAILYYNPIKLFLLLSIMTFVGAFVCFIIYFSNGAFFTLYLGMSFFIISFVLFGMGLITEAMRKKENIRE